MYPRRKQGTGKGRGLGGEGRTQACDSAEVETCSVSPTAPQPPVEMLLEGSNLLIHQQLSYTITSACSRREEGPAGAQQNPTLAFRRHLSPWIINLPGRFTCQPGLLNESAAQTCGEPGAVLSTQGEQMKHLPADSYCRCSPQLRNVWETLVMLFLRCCREDLFCK